MRGEGGSEVLTWVSTVTPASYHRARTCTSCIIIVQQILRNYSKGIAKYPESRIISDILCFVFIYFKIGNISENDHFVGMFKFS